MIRAAELYDPVKAKFTTYAARCMWSFMVRVSRDSGVIHRPTRPVAELPGVSRLDPRLGGDRHDPAARDGPSRAELADAAYREVHDAIGRVTPEEWRDALRLKLSGMTLTQIGEARGATKQAAGLQMKKAMRALGKALKAARGVE